MSEKKELLTLPGKGMKSINSRINDLYTDVSGENSMAVSNAIFDSDREKFVDYMVRIGTEARLKLADARSKFGKMYKPDIKHCIEVGDKDEFKFETDELWSEELVSKLSALFHTHNSLSDRFEAALEKGTKSNWEAVETALNTLNKALKNA